VNILAGFADISLGQLVLVGGMALLASIVGGLAGYGTGALMPLVLVPLIGAEPVVPIIAISAIITNISRFVAYFRYADRRRALIVIAAAALTTALGAYGYTRLTSTGAALVIGSMLILSVPCAGWPGSARSGLAIPASASAQWGMAWWSAAPQAPA
jgi:uncharacterized membrane protein YfcA